MTLPDPETYYGRPILKEPFWKWYVPAYFFSGGLAGASSTLAFVARLRGNTPLARRARLASLAAIAVSPALLVADLGRPERFANMLRVARPTSPLSMGSWLLTAFGPASGAAAMADVTGLLPRIGTAADIAAGVLGPMVTTYTAVLTADTAIPAWHDAHRELPFVYAGSAAASAAGAALILTPLEHAAPARRLAALASGVELGATRLMHGRLGVNIGAPYLEGEAGKLGRAARASTVAGAAIAMSLGRRRRTAAVLGGALLLAGSALTRFSVYRAGFESARDPYAIVGPRARPLEER